jgi:hypothetical protein
MIRSTECLASGLVVFLSINDAVVLLVYSYYFAYDL